jgi:hypothetical protein
MRALFLCNKGKCFNNGKPKTPMRSFILWAIFERMGGLAGNSETKRVRP